MPALTCLCLCSLTAACATVSERKPIPESLLTDCRVPEWKGKTYRDLAVLAEQRLTALEDCNAQLGEVRKYQSRVNP